MPVPVQSSQRICFRRFELDLTSGELRKDGQKVPLPPKAFEVLRALVEHPGEVVTRENLRTRLWPADTFVEFEDSLNMPLTNSAVFWATLPRIPSSSRHCLDLGTASSYIRSTNRPKVRRGVRLRLSLLALRGPQRPLFSAAPFRRTRSGWRFQSQY